MLDGDSSQHSSPGSSTIVGSARSCIGYGRRVGLTPSRSRDFVPVGGVNHRLAALSHYEGYSFESGLFFVKLFGDAWQNNHWMWYLVTQPLASLIPSRHRRYDKRPLQWNTFNVGRWTTQVLDHLSEQTPRRLPSVFKQQRTVQNLRGIPVLVLYGEHDRMVDVSVS